MSDYEYSYFNKETHEPIGEIELHEVFDDYLDEAHGTTKIAGMTYDTSNALKQVDPVAYEQEYDGWLDSELGETYLDKDGLDDAITDRKEEILDGLEEENLSVDEKMELYDEVMKLYFPCETFEETEAVIVSLKERFGDVNPHFVNGNSQRDHDDFFKYLDGEVNSYGDAYSEEYSKEENERLEQCFNSETGGYDQDDYDTVQKKMQAWVADNEGQRLQQMYDMYDNNQRDELRETLEAKQTPTIQERWAQKPKDEDTEAQDKPKQSNTFKR